MNDAIHPRGRLTCGIDATSLFGPYTGSPVDGWPTRILNRLDEVRMLSTELRHNVQVIQIASMRCTSMFIIFPFPQRKINDKTYVSLMSRISRQGRASGIELLGTVRHQFSPRFTSEVGFSRVYVQPAC